MKENLILLIKGIALLLAVLAGIAIIAAVPVLFRIYAGPAIWTLGVIIFLVISWLTGRAMFG